MQVLYAGTSRDIDLAFEDIARKQIEALLVYPSPFFATRRVQLATQAVRHAIPTIYPYRETAAVGGLISYNPDLNEQHRLLGVYAGRILKGEKPADMPVMRPTKFELIINRQTARVLGIEVPATLLAQADEVIE